MVTFKVAQAMTIKLDKALPEIPVFQEGVRRAPNRGGRLTYEQTKVALKNALRNVPEELHDKLAPEFMEELKTYGRIYAYRYMPKERIYGKPIHQYKGNCIEGKAFQVMIDNNLDHANALYPYEVDYSRIKTRLDQGWVSKVSDDLMRFFDGQNNIK